MNFSTNQVMQFYCISSAPTVKINAASGSHGSKLCIEGLTARGLRSDIIDIDKIQYITLKKASDLTDYRKALVVALANNPIIGEEYNLTLTVRGTIGEEVAISKVLSAYATTTTKTDVYEELVKSLLLKFPNADAPQFFEVYEVKQSSGVYVADSTKQIKLVGGELKTGSSDTVLTNGFAIVEAKPDWDLGRFPLATMNVEASVSPIIVSGVPTLDWLTVGEDVKFTKDTSFPVVNSGKIADMEYFASGERGTESPLAGWPIRPSVTLDVNGKSANGYSVLDIHYAHVGALDSVQKSEKDLIIVAEGDSAAGVSGLLTNIKSAIEAEMLETRVEALEDAE